MEHRGLVDRLADRARRQPALSAVRARQRHLARRLRDRLSGTRFADAPSVDRLPVVVVRHATPLRRRLAGTDPALQETKIVNLRLAAATLDGIVIGPGETVSFWRRVGRPTAARGYREGLVLVGGRPSAGIGGGLCQLSNLLHWMALHTELEVTERHHHSVDPFPDDRRELPFGSGASVAFDTLDLRLHNPTDRPFQLSLAVEEPQLVGAVLTTTVPPVRLEIVERDHRFERDADGTVVRCNTIVRRRLDTATGAVLAEDVLMRSRSRVAYPVADVDIDAGAGTSATPR